MRLQERVKGWKDYELIDFGRGEKLERFGNQFIIRSESKALTNRSLSREKWQELVKSSSHSIWQIEFGLDSHNSFKMELKKGHSKQIGLFPEQAPNWRWIYHRTVEISKQNRREGREAPRVLNLFAYSGGASLAAKKGGADLFHVESVRQSISLAKRNMEISSLQDIRWVQEDALKFMAREVKRGRKYQGIILDPPAYGLGPKGERWSFKESITRVMALAGALLERRNSFIVLNLYTADSTPQLADSLLREGLKLSRGVSTQFGSLTVVDKFGKVIEMSHFARALL